MNLALAGTGLVLLLESQKAYDFGERLFEDGVPEEYYQVDQAEPPSLDALAAI